MKIKKKSIFSLQAIFAGALIGFIYFKIIALPVLRGESDIYAIPTGDVLLFMDPIAQETYIKQIGTVNYGVTQFNVLGMVLIAKAAMRINYEKPEYILFLFNILLLTAAIRNFQYIFTFYDSSHYGLFLLFFLLNPFVIMSLVYLNKEMLGIFFISCFVRYKLYRKYGRFFIAVFLSFLIRDVFFVAGILFFLMSTFKIKKIYYLIFISLLTPFIVPEGMVDLLVQGQDEFSTGFSLLINKIQFYPFGYLITYFPKLLLDLFASLSPIRFFYFEPNNIVAIFTKVSSFLILIFSLIISYRYLFLKRILPETVVTFFFSYSFIACLTPFIHHRYIFPVYPVIILVVLISYGAETVIEKELQERF